jgi:hypothetical protein
MLKLGILVGALLLVSPAAQAQTRGKDTVAKERAPGTTGDIGNRCVGGNYNSCVQANIKVGWTARGAAGHCARTCAK